MCWPFNEDACLAGNVGPSSEDDCLSINWLAYLEVLQKMQTPASKQSWFYNCMFSSFMFMMNNMFHVGERWLKTLWSNAILLCVYFPHSAWCTGSGGIAKSKCVCEWRLHDIAHNVLNICTHHKKNRCNEGFVLSMCLLPSLCMMYRFWKHC